jgi:hypothetical protein
VKKQKKFVGLAKLIFVGFNSVLVSFFKKVGFLWAFCGILQCEKKKIWTDMF